ncbi:MAG: BlaI/MecI/CopY family transcriptional regulator [Clostridia bacterium]
MPEEKVRLSDAEWRLMQILWEKGTCTFRQICNAVMDETGWTKHSVISFLKRMETKYAIEIIDAKPVKLYKPVLNKEQALFEETHSLLKKIYNGDLMLMVSNAARQQKLSDDEIDELVSLLKTEVPK